MWSPNNDNSSLAHPTQRPEGPLLKTERKKGETILVRKREREREREREKGHIAR